MEVIKSHDQRHRAEIFIVSSFEDIILIYCFIMGKLKLKSEMIILWTIEREGEIELEFSCGEMMGDSSKKTKQNKKNEEESTEICYLLLLEKNIHLVIIQALC